MNRISSPDNWILVIPVVSVIAKISSTECSGNTPTGSEFPSCIASTIYFAFSSLTHLRESLAKIMPM
ncbi:Uncharacterised protein [Chlamydia trachomatis]|nr:Uncharacterised protein [Chlamydia trachomatis]